MKAHRDEERRRRAAVRALLPKAAFLGVSEDELIRRALFVTRDSGGDFVLPGDTPDVLYVVGLGAVMTTVPRSDADGHPTGRHLIVQVARPGQVIMLGPVGSTSTGTRFGARAAGKSTVVALNRDFLLDVLRRQPAEKRLLLAAYQARALSRLLGDAAHLLLESLDERLELRLHQLLHAFPAPADRRAIDPHLRLSQTDLAQMVGSTRSSVSRALGRLVKRNVLEPGLPALRFVRPPAPVQLARGDDGRVFRRPLENDLHRHDFARLLETGRRHLALPAATIDALLRHAELVAYARGEHIAVSEDVFATVLVRGVARVDCAVGAGRLACVWMARSGHFIGAGWIGSGARAAAFTAHAHEACVVAVLHPPAMMAALKTLDERQLLHFYGHCHAALSGHLYDKYQLLGLEAADRLLYQLRLLARDFGRPHPAGTAIDLDLTDFREVAPRLLGRFIGTVPTTAAKAWAALRRRGQADFVEGRIVLPGFRPADASDQKACERTTSLSFTGP